MPSDHSPTPTAGPGAQTVTVATPAGPVALGVGSAREAVALVVTIAAHWPHWPAAVIGPAGGHRKPTETPTGTTPGRTETPGPVDREHRDTDREHHRESDREHPLPRPAGSRPVPARSIPAA